MSRGSTMLRTTYAIIFQFVFCIFLTINLPVNAEVIPSSYMKSAIQTEAGQIIPSNDFGVVDIEKPRVASLLQLRGIIGYGTIALRTSGNLGCATIPIRFIASDFGGDDISTDMAQPIKLLIRSERVVQAIRNGKDIVSDMYRISTNLTAHDADIVIQSGLSSSHGFVLNLGKSVLADIFGTTLIRTNCTLAVD